MAHSMGVEDGELFIKSLAYYVRTHEKALANALQSEARDRRPSTSSGGAKTAASVSQASATASTFTAALAAPFRHFSTPAIKSAKLTLTPNQVYYLLSRFEELGTAVGPLNIRMENISAETPSSNYVSFLSRTPKPSGRDSDHDSVHSVSSVRSVVSTMSTMLASFNLTTEAKVEKRRAALLEDLRYLYSSFTKVPCIRLINDHRARRIAGYEEFPFDTAVPLLVFKNATVVEIKDVDFRAFFGWDGLAEQVRSLTVKRADLTDLADLLTNIVLDDIDKRRRRSSKSPLSPVFAVPTPVLGGRQSVLARSMSTKSAVEHGRTRTLRMGEESETVEPASGAQKRPSGSTTGRTSPTRPPSSSQASVRAQSAARRYSSESSSSSATAGHMKRNSSAGLLQLGTVVTPKWRFLSHLCIADNGLTSLSPASLSPVASTLRSLDLSSNLFTEVPEALATLVGLRALNLSNCLIGSVRSLSRCPLPAISVLNMKGNQISALVGIEKLLSLERFDIRHNLLSDPAELSRLTEMPDFRDVYVIGNPFVSKFTNYRTTIFNLFRSRPGFAREITIDFSAPTYSERRHLIDRATEPVYPPIVKRPYEDDVDNTIGSPGGNPRVLQPLTQHSKTVGTQDSISKRQRTRRRNVDMLVHETSHKSPRMSQERRISGQNVYAEPRRRAPGQASGFMLDVRGSPVLLAEAGDRHSISTDDASCATVVDTDSDVSSSRMGATLEESSSTYTQRIESLGLDYGPNWLRDASHREVFGDTWINPFGSLEPAISPRSSFTAKAAPVRSISAQHI